MNYGKTEYFDRWRAGETMKININTKERTFELVYNNGKVQTVFEEIEFPETTEYYFAISNYGDADDVNCIELISFKHLFLK